jgi:hypothetical protein
MQTITLVRLTSTGVDAYGNPEFNSSTESISCNVGWGATGQTPGAARSAQDSACHLYIFDQNLDLSDVDYFEIEGLKWILDGQSQIWWCHEGYVGTVVQLRRRDG